VQTSGMGEQGLFYKDTRHLSELSMNLWGTRPLLLSSTVETGNFLFTGDLANLDVYRENKVVIPRGTLHVLRSRFLWKNSCYEEVAFVNHGMAALSVPFQMKFAADFADIFEVRGMHRERRGKNLPPAMGRDSVLLAYEGLDGVRRQTLIRWSTPQTKATESELQYDVALRPKEHASFHLFISCEADAAARSIGYSRAIGADTRPF